jgi:hypothetical protein
MGVLCGVWYPEQDFDCVRIRPVTNGGWVIVARQGEHQSLVGLDRNGKPLETLDARNWTWTLLPGIWLPIARR